MAAPEVLLFIEDYIGQFDQAGQAYLRAHYRRYLKTFEACPEISGARVLDIGGGGFYGELLTRFKAYRFEEIEGDSIDFESSLLPYETEAFDGVMLCEVLEHFTEDPMHCLLEVNRITKPGGFFVCTTPNCVSWYSIHCALRHLHPSRWAHYSATHKHIHSIHAREYVPHEMRPLFYGAGYSVDFLDTFDYGDTDLEWGPIPGFPTEDRGETIICVGRKEGPPRMRYIKECYAGYDVSFTEENRYR